MDGAASRPSRLQVMLLKPLLVKFRRQPMHPVTVYNMPELSTQEKSLFGARDHVYGEITGFRALATACGLAPADSFVDLGSGLGTVVLQAAEEFSVRRACGVELAPSRHRLAVAARSAASKDVRSRSVFVQGDIGDPKISTFLQEARTVVWLSNLLYEETLVRRIVRQIEAAPTVRVVAALRPIVDGMDGFVADPSTVLCQMSWEWHPCTIYRRVPTTIPALR